MNNLTAIAVLLILLGVSARIFPHPANFAPIAAIALFGGLYLSKRWALILPLSAMFVSDIFVGFYSWKMMVAVYASFLLIVGIGMMVKRKKEFATILGGTLLGSMLFFLITNGAVWAFGTMYTHSFAGLMQSYLMGIPFLKNTLLGDLFFTGILVGSMEAIALYKTKLFAKQSV
ncbi:MAG: hypothetical protein CO030_02610 [Candidatus Magasanikbacteria bacterium CG_4_9_14_0_2_um_filter_42_11]|uniref:ECF transporter S component n=1 Tax=Candidatus Magasanikbacteria bacterium CG_4_9_14_0_2_um_filter_42_11 TaxID=1974643 RepID=A0A2M8F9Z4_9BACT|nr:MAG: hypothetical protein CO030_02610 [Candidatus Magasanikbacteria bacterium CG_4_9_14_0_2_um_filter_42_11]